MSRSAALAIQPALPGLCLVTDAVGALAAAGHEERGAVFTKREVVEFMLDLAGYKSDYPLHKRRLLEPSFGDGDFLIPALERLLSAYEATGRDDAARDLKNAIRGVELHHDSHGRVRENVIQRLTNFGLSLLDARTLADTWLQQGDFLLTEFDRPFDHVVGNPPYIRQELIPQVLIEEYRRRFETIFDRADIYVPFIERGLRLLSEHGSLAFICADRWMKNRYGGPLRRFVAKRFRLLAYVDMVNTDAFHSEVMAYPAIFVIGRDGPIETRIAHRPEISRQKLQELAQAMTSPDVNGGAVRSCEIVGKGDEPWIFENFEELALLRKLEAKFAPLEEVGCKVGIGVATGADKAFIGKLSELDVEDDRKLPLVMTRDIASGEVLWRGLGVINPFQDDGKLVPLGKYPRFAKFVHDRREQIARRHIAQKVPANWYRTIDRIYPSLVTKPKLLIPDIKGAAHIVYDEGKFYPHHNLYFITSEEWDLRALQAVLRSGIGRLFVSAYSTKMRGGYLRFQAQYLRRIRVPAWRDVARTLRDRLIAAGQSGQIADCNVVAAALYNLSEAEQEMLSGGKVSNEH